MKKILRLTFSISLLLTSITLYSQKYANNWHINDFDLALKNDTVKVIPGISTKQHCSAGIISDNDGNLLFYSDGHRVWNRNHNLMPNGTDLNILYGTESLVIPKPSADSIYYIFTVESWNGQESAGLYYSVVDMKQNDGLGDVITKGVKILDKTSNKITSVFHENGKDIWLITHVFGTNSYYSYLISASGISDSPIVSSLGNVSTSSYAGQLKASPDGKKMACSYDDWSTTTDDFDLFDFNNATGELTNSMSFSLPVTYRGADGLEFSSDGTKLFVVQTGSTGESGLHQYDVSLKTYDEIKNSRVRVSSERYNGYTVMQLAPNGKIYISKGGGGGGTGHLGVVENPNEYGENCIVHENGLYLNGGTSFVGRTPNFIQNYFFRTNFTVDGSCQSAPVSFAITNEYKLDSVRWYFGEGSTSATLHPAFIYNDPGSYTVRLLAYYPEKCDTISKQITINPYTPIDFGDDTSICFGDKITVHGNFESYLWNDGDTTFYNLVEEEGQYKATVTNNFGCKSSDSIYIKVVDLPVINLPDTVILGDQDSVKLYAGDFSTYKWSTGDTSSFLLVKDEGWYSVRVENKLGCDASKSVLVLKKLNSDSEDDTDWKIINPAPSYLSGRGIYFMNEKLGFTINDKGLLKTTDGGEKWQKVMALSSGNKIKFKNSIGYIIGNNGTIYKSTHDGAGWNKLNTTFTDNLNSISLITEDTVIITSNNKLFLSNDGGQTWEPRAINGGFVNDAFFTSSKVGHAACNSGRILKTVDGGINWYSTISSNSFPSDFFRIEFVNDSIGFASREFDYLYKTTNGGETWQNIKSLDAVYDMQFLDTETGFLCGEYGTIFRTNDGGKNWQNISPTVRIDAYDVYGIFFTNRNEGFATGARGRILKTENRGDSWEEYAPTYLDISQLNFVSDSIAYMLVSNTIYKTTDGGKNIINTGPPIPGQKTKQFSFINQNIGYVIAGGSTQNSEPSQKVYKTINGGTTWQPTSTDFGYFNENFYSIDFINEALGFVSGGFNQQSVFRTKNGGNTWEKVENISFRQIQFTDSLNGYGLYYSRLYKTADGGDSWSIVFENEDDINSFHFIDKLTGYLTGDYGMLFKTDDGGKNWKKLTIPYEYYVYIRFISKNIGFILNEDGKLYKTADGGENWKLWTDLYGINSIDIQKEYIYIYGTYGKILTNSIKIDSVSVHINRVDSLTNTRALISGTVASNGAMIDSVIFTYYESDTLLNQIARNVAIDNDSSANVSVLLTNLESNKTYYYSLYAVQGGKKYYSNTGSFKTLNDYEISLNSVYEYSSDQAKLSGQIISRDTTITGIEFQYSIDNSFENSIAATPNLVLANETADVEARLASLTPNTQYYVRLKANYKGQSIYSSTTSFRTTPEYLLNMYTPYVNGKSLTIQGYIQAYKDTITNFIILYGKSRDYDLEATVVPDKINKGDQQSFECHLNDLDSNTVYFYRPCFVLGSDTIYGDENIFNLNHELDIAMLGVEQISDNSVVVKAIVNSYGAYVHDIKFMYGRDREYTDSIYSFPSYNYSYNSKIVQAIVNRLIPNSEYAFKLSTIYNSNRVYSDSISFFLNGTTDIIERNTLSGVSIYPNPTEQFVTIKCSNPVSSIELRNLQGVALIKSDKLELDMSEFPSGVYLVKVFFNKKFVTRKIIKK